MIIAVQGTNEFNDYNIFLRAMSVALSNVAQDDKEILVYSVGPAQINAFVSEFCNLSERGLKARGKKIKYFKVAPFWLEENMEYVNYFIYVCKPNQNMSKLAGIAELNNIEVGIFKY